ncbi:hypothetical protein EMIHUDRAFT_452073 [Emiliania huxleyi CCMP1516]|uniref:Uncharacterized protein n=2 Tax=Emiliania huxleyi TaxID=2903 RepID=A0A0D3INI7_EMIH1|nr:hypothetical protein EMIHUDRAFT_452073 [Emiliania huxleyi CCMP1516]EOD12822.1 hypothetical protein EMIHUDRAFT_452073 [Emiliania huxleyi CCMP1516]|eukprot:XP_005765251.1 hypothetical protein EMIHUDRAFT_452073 [Emiliania huxleyi CCMP1516]
MCRGDPPGRPAAQAPTGTAGRLEQRKNKNRTGQSSPASLGLIKAAKNRKASFEVAAGRRVAW